MSYSEHFLPPFFLISPVEKELEATDLSFLPTSQNLSYKSQKDYQKQCLKRKLTNYQLIYQLKLIQHGKQILLQELKETGSS